MNLSNFEQYMDPTIIARGHSYFLDDLADKPRQMKPGVWRAKVYGTYTYHVEIHINPENHDEIKSWRCDCPYDYGPVCKHVVATLYAMYEDGKLKSAASDKKEMASPSEKKKEIFKETSHEDLQEFIKKCFATTDGFENRFLAYFADRLDEEPDQKYRTIISNYIRAAKGPHGFIDYDAAYSLTQPLWELNKKADKLLYAGNIRESLTICQVLVEEVAEVAGNIDYSEGGVRETITSAFNTLSELIEKAPPVIKDELFEWCLSEISYQKYRNYGFESSFLYLLPQLVSSEKQEERFFALLEHQIARAKESQHSDYSVSRLVRTKIDYLQKDDREKEVLHLLESNIHFWEFRMRLVDRALSDNDFEQAKKLCREGIEKVKEKNSWRSSTRWKEKLYQIAEIEEDTPTMREWAEELFLNGYNMQWYNALRDTYSKDKWADKCEELLNHIKGPKQRGGYGKANTMADIFIEEGYKKRLLKLLQLNDNNFPFVKRYASEINDEYPYEILDFYKKGIGKYAYQTGRKRYRQIAVWLEDMKKITGGDERAYDLFKSLLRKYNNRPAMKDEFYKAFPQWEDTI